MVDDGGEKREPKMIAPKQISRTEITFPAMSLNVPKPDKQELRLKYIEEHFLFETHEEMAKNLNVSRKTVERDLKNWVDTGGMFTFLYREFFELYGLEKRKNPSKALDRILVLLLKTIPDKLESKEEIHEYRHVIELVDPDSPAQDTVQKA